MTFVSIVVTTTNTSATQLNQTLSTVTGQTFRADQFEIIVVDDGSSPDATEAELPRLGSLRNCTIVRNEQRAGTLASRARGATAATGEFVMFVDSGDMLTRDAAESQFYRARSLGADVVLAPWQMWDSATRTYRPSALSNVAVPSNPHERTQVIFGVQCDLTVSGRLIARHLLTEAAFPGFDPGPFGDLAMMWHVLAKANKIGYHDRFYSYQERDSSGFGPQDFAESLEGLRRIHNYWHQATRELNDPHLSKSITTGIARVFGTITRQAMQSGGANSIDAIEADAASREFGGGPVDARSARDLAVSLLHRDDEYSTRGARGLQPSRMAVDLADKIVLICQANYQLRGAGPFVNELRQSGYECVVLDNSHAIADGKRASTIEDHACLHEHEYVRVMERRYGPDWLATARFVAVFNDFMPEFREALEYRHRLGLPTACVVEGINDFERVDFAGHHFLSYRRCDYVFTAGDDDARFFPDRVVYMVGLPRIEELAKTQAQFPDRPLVALNLNFSYGVLNAAAAESYLEVSRAAFMLTGLDWTITQHPMDTTRVAPRALFGGTQYDLLRECTVFVSRFATGILEALAVGKPAIYFNPHGEVIDKFLDPLGAFAIANDTFELTAALERSLADVDAGVDFRARATEFLRLHTGWSPDEKQTAAERFAVAVKQIDEASRSKVDTANAAVAGLPNSDQHATPPSPGNGDLDGISRPRYADAADRLRERWPSGYTMFQILHRELPPALGQRRLGHIVAILRRALASGFSDRLAWPRPAPGARKVSPLITAGLTAAGVLAADRCWRRNLGRFRTARRVTRLASLGLGSFVAATTVREMTKDNGDIRGARQAPTLSSLDAAVAELRIEVERSQLAQSESQQRFERAMELAIQELRRKIEEALSSMSVERNRSQGR